MADIVLHDSDEEGAGGRRKGRRSGSLNVPLTAAGDVAKPNVVYVGRIPHGFYEKQMREFFEQFGSITKLRISRNKTTGKSKHYGFIQFAVPEVASIVAESMNNYLLFESMLQVKLVPAREVDPRLWVGANREFKVGKFQMRRRMQPQSKIRSAPEQERRLRRLLQKDGRRRNRLKTVGIEYDFPDIRALLPAKSKKIKFEN